MASLELQKILRAVFNSVEHLQNILEDRRLTLGDLSEALALRPEIEVLTSVNYQKAKDELLNLGSQEIVELLKLVGKEFPLPATQTATIIRSIFVELSNIIYPIENTIKTAARILDLTKLLGK